MPFTTCYPTNSSYVIEKPKKLQEMLDVVKKISNSLNNPKYLRVDLYVINQRIYFGEVTFYHGSGMEKFDPEEWDYKLGQMLNLK